MNKNSKIWWIVGISLAAVVALAGYISTARADSAAVAQPDGAQVVTLDVAEAVSASGALEAQPYAELAWKTSGVVETVYVQAGDPVKAGDILMRLQVTSAPANVISAQTDLVNAQQALDDLLNSNLDYANALQTLATAKQALEDAQDDVDKLDNKRATSEKLDEVEAEIAVANKKVSLAEDAYKSLKDLDDNDSRKAQAYLNLTNARADRDAKQAKLDWYLGTYSDLDAEKYRAAFAVAEARVADAQREVDRLKDGPAASDIAAAQARVDAAQATVNGLYIVAPFDGQVLSVMQGAGSVVNTGEPAVKIANLEQLYVDAQVDEADVAKVQVGQQAQVTLDALDGVVFKGAVAAIDPVGENVSGLVKYTVRIDLEAVTETQAFLPLGTTANVNIEVQAASAALAVPITTIQNDAQGEFVLVTQADGSTQRVAVVTGAIVNDLVVVSGAVQAGDRLQLNSASSFSAPNPFGGGGE